MWTLMSGLLVKGLSSSSFFCEHIKQEMIYLEVDSYPPVPRVQIDPGSSTMPPGVGVLSDSKIQT